MKNVKKIARVLVLLSFMAYSFILPFRVFASTTNLISNPSVETSSNNLPTNWSTNHWGTNNANFSYVTNGHTGSRSLSVQVSGYASGDAKWMPDATPVTAGDNYTYSDYSQATVGTELDAAYTNANGVMSFVYLTSLSASTAWRQNTTTFTVPAGAVNVSIYHIIASNGTLQTDDFSLTDNTSTTGSGGSGSGPTTSGNNLITNSSFETSNGTVPTGWNHGGWGTNTSTLSYVSGGAHTGSYSAKTVITSYTNGDAKWYATPVAVTAGTTYAYQDYYSASVPTPVTVAMTNTSGADSYQNLAVAPAASGWTQYNASFTVPNGITAVTIYHLLNSVGSLSLDDVSLAVAAVTPPPPTPSNYITNPSFETANGTKPAGWSTDSWGSNTHTFSYVKNDGHTGTKSAKVTVSNYVSGDAKWDFTPLDSLKPGSQYHLSAWYKTNTQPHVVASYVDASGVQQYATLSNPLPSSTAATTWQQYGTTLDIPLGASSVTVYFLLSSNGWLQTDDFSLTDYTPIGFNAPIISLTFDDGWSSIYTNGLPILQKYGFNSTQFIISGKLNTPNYMTTADVQAFQSAGSEIGAHTVTHPDLTLVSPAQLTSELSDSQVSLRSLFGPTAATDFATPYGNYNSMVLASIRQYYQSHRSTDVGYNTKDTFNPYDIVVQNVDTDTTPVQVAEWVNKAKAEMTWLVLVFHQVSTSSDPTDYAVTPANLDTELSNIKSSGVSVQTLSQALQMVESQL